MEKKFLKRATLGGFLLMSTMMFGKNPTVVMIPKVIGSPYFDIAAEGAKNAGKDLGIDVIYNGPTSGDAARQVNIIQDVMNKNVDAIIISPNDANAVMPALERASKRGIKILTYDADTARESGRDLFVNQVSAEQLGRHIMDNIAKGIGEEGEFAIITASLTAANQNTWIHWMKEQLKDKYPKINLVTVVPSEEDQQRAFIQTQNLVKAYPNLKAIAALSTVAQPGASQAIEQMGLNGKVKVYGLATPNGMRQYLKSGAAQSATLWEPEKLGYLSVVMAESLIRGKEIKDGDAIKNVGTIQYDSKTKTVIMGPPMDFTAENVDKYDF